VLLPVALIATIIPDLFFDHTGTFLAFLGVIFAPMVGIQITDYFFLRKGRLNLQGLYDNSAKSAYYFVGGVNPAACVAVVIGFITYIYLLNPVTFVSHGWFKYTSASLPAIFISAGAYYLVSKMYVFKAGIGGYGKAHYLAESDAGLSGNYEKA
jgi:NCS1 family nucleobase:cation symporter-1